MNKANIRALALGSVVAVLFGCGGGGGDAPLTYTVGGVVSGLAGAGLTLQLGGASNLAVNSSGNFSFPTSLNNGSAYSVAVSAQPTSPSQTCAVANGSGTVGNANVSNVMVTCTTNSYQVGVTVSGLSGSGLVLQNHGADDLAIANDGAFSFATLVASGSTYDVTVKTQPTATPAETCAVNNGTGTVGSAAVAGVSVSCRALVAKFLYVPNRVTNNVSAFAVNASTGTLTAISGSPFAVGATPQFAQTNPSGKFLYVGNQGQVLIEPASVSGYVIDGGTGALTAVPNSPLNLTASLANTYITTATFHPTRNFVYFPLTTDIGPANSGYLVSASINPATGELTALPASPSSAGTLIVYEGVFDPTGSYLYFALESWTPTGFLATYPVDLATGAIPTTANPIATGGILPVRPVIDAAGKFLYASNLNGGVAAFAISPADGSLTAVAGSPFATGTGKSGQGSVIHPSGQFIYVATRDPLNSDALGIVAFSIDATTGVLTPIAGSPIATTSVASTIAFPIIDPKGKFLYVNGPTTGTIEGYSISKTTGALSAIPGSPFATGSGTLVYMDPSGQYLYSVGQNSNDIRSYSVHPTTGALTLVNTLPTGSSPGWTLGMSGLH